MNEFFRNKWPEILIIVFVLGLGGLAWDTNNRLTVQETRTGMIVAALPDLRTRVAYETVNMPFRSAVVVMKPRQEGEQWSALIQVVDAESGMVTSYEAQLEGNDAKKLNWQVIGSVMQADRKAVNFREMQSMAKEVKEPAFTPESVNDEASFVIYSEPENVTAALKAFGLQVVGVKPLPDVKTWPGLANAMGVGELGEQP